jgi:predicted transcriptional regulator
MTARQLLHSIIDELPEEELGNAARYLDFLNQQDNLLDDPDYQEFLLQRIEECKEAEARGEVYTTDQVKEMVTQWISESTG